MLTMCHIPLQVIFEVAFNGPKGGHVALDDISFSPVHCQNQTGKHVFFFSTFGIFLSQWMSVVRA